MTLRTRADEQLGAVIANWQRALTLYAHGLRAQDVREVNRAFDAIRAAEAREARAQQLLRLLERSQRDAGAEPGRDAR
jgi:hypothetical protein